MSQSQNKTVLEYLKSGKSLTSWEAIQMWKITRLGGRIWDIENKMGYKGKIKHELISENGKKFEKYTFLGGCGVSRDGEHGNNNHPGVSRGADNLESDPVVGLNGNASLNPVQPPIFFDRKKKDQQIFPLGV